MQTKENNQNTLETLTPPEVAKILQVTTKTLEVWRRTGRQSLPFIRIGRSIRYDPKDVQSYLRRQRCGINNS